MNDPNFVNEHEHGIVRLFVVVRPMDMGRGALLPVRDLADLLGVKTLNESDVQQIWTDDLIEMSLQELLQSGYGISKDQLGQHEDTIDATGEMHPTLYVIIRSSAFVDRPVKLTPKEPLFLLATLREPESSVTFEPLPNPDPQAVIEDPRTRKPKSDAAIGGRVATVALLLMFLLVVLMVWVAS